LHLSGDRVTEKLNVIDAYGSGEFELEVEGGQIKEMKRTNPEE